MEGTDRETGRTMEFLSLQDRYAPQNKCFGCGPANAQGLRIKSFADGDETFATWTPSPHHQAFDGVLNGGIIGALLDCHSNWTAAYHLMKRSGAESPPCTVTAEYAVQLRRPCPVDNPVHLRAQVVESTDDGDLRGDLLAVVDALSGRGAPVEDVLAGDPVVREPLTWLRAFLLAPT
jgi:acyl-coenzyme A thioesterase PaaI-like protein